MPDSPVNAAEFRNAMAEFPSGVTVVTTMNERDQPVGFTANAFSSLSMDPALILVCPALTSATYPHLLRTGQFAVHILAAGQKDIAMAFASKGGEKAAAVPWRRSALGNPLLPGASCILECTLWNDYAGGDHAIVVGEVKRIDRSDNGVLLYHRGMMSSHAVGQSGA